MRSEGRHWGLEEFRSFACPFFDVIPAGSLDAFRAYSTSRRLGPLILSEVAFDAAIFDRDPGRLRGYDTEFLLLETYARGSNHGHTDDIPTALDAHSVHVVDMARPWVSQTTAVSCRSVVIPYSIVGYDPSRDPAYSRLPDYSPRTAMLLAATAALFESGKDLDLEEAEALSEGFAALVRRLLLNLGDRCPEAGPTDGNALFIRRFIDERLSDPDLTPQRLCDALRISRASLYRMFSEEGGVHSYITSRRLERCFHELHQARPQRGRVRTIAERWGFFDPPSFTRSFRRRFGITPLECMEASIDGDSQAGASAHPVQDWLKRP